MKKILAYNFQSDWKCSNLQQKVDNYFSEYKIKESSERFAAFMTQYLAAVNKFKGTLPEKSAQVDKLVLTIDKAEVPALIKQVLEKYLAVDPIDLETQVKDLKKCFVDSCGNALDVATAIEKGETGLMSWFIQDSCPYCRGSVRGQFIEEGNFPEELLAISRQFPTQKPLHLAVQQWNTDAVKNLLELKKVDINELDEHGYTALHYAVLNGDEMMLEKLLNQQADFTITTKEGLNSLHLAIQDKQLSIAHKLLHHGLNPDAQTTNSAKQTALHYAVTANNIILVRLLLAYKADIGIEDAANMTPIELAEVKGFNQIAKFLEFTQESRTMLMRLEENPMDLLAFRRILSLLREQIQSGQVDLHVFGRFMSLIGAHPL